MVGWRLPAASLEASTAAKWGIKKGFVCTRTESTKMISRVQRQRRDWRDWAPLVIGREAFAVAPDGALFGDGKFLCA